MSNKPSRPVERKPRADAERNRARVLEAAKAAFTASGVETSLDEIARAAGVGPGTLYRHFPTRDALLEAVYRTEVEKLALAGRELALTHSPPDALRAWLLLFVDYITAKKIIAPALSTLVQCHPTVVEATRTLIHTAMRSLVQRAVESGDVRADLDPIDLLSAIVGVAHVPFIPDWQQTARRLVDILIAGSRPVA